jgi:hypothetical protein
MRIIVTEFPKSGGSWLTSMLADVLGIPARDLYVDNSFKTFDLTNHPWYLGDTSWELTESCLIKSHEWYGTIRHNFPANTLHLMRDGRDVVVSKYFFHKDFEVNNQITESFDYAFDEFVEKTAIEWAEYVTAWSAADVLQVTYEELLNNTFETLRGILRRFDIDVGKDQIIRGIQANTREKFREKLGKAFSHNTFVRKAVSGDWANYFSPENKQVFKKAAGEALIAMGYERDMSW